MAKPKKNKRLPKDVMALTNDDVMRRVFGKRQADKLKEVAHENDSDEPEKPSPVNT